jgi:prepilin-type N-terminal cleavage/methylation domain-containing protein
MLPHQFKTARRGFTLVEMLTVIGIIVLLVSILLPVVGAVRTRGHIADTQAMLARIGAGIQSYYSDFNAYPGPLHNGQIYNGGVPVTIQGLTGENMTQITQAENLVLGLLGGLKLDPQGRVTYDASMIGGGPMSLNARSPKRYRSYMDKISLSGGEYSDEVVDANTVKDSLIPEFLDRFPDGMPILYLRANNGAPGIATDKQPVAQQQQYDVKQIEAYTTVNIGAGKELPAEGDYSGVQATDPLKHGLRTAMANATSINPPPTGSGHRYIYPYDLVGFLRQPSMANTPRQQNAFIMISAGADRVYGTKDDVTYPPSR